MRVIDCSLIIDMETEHPGFPRSKVYGKPESKNKIYTIANHEENHLFVCGAEICCQHFTHYDAPSHYIKGGFNNEEVPLDWLVGEGVVIDMMHKGPNEAVTAADLEASGMEVRPGDIAIIRTGWTDKCFGTWEFWRDMPYLSTDAAEWLMQKKIKALAQDFMTCDPPLNPPPERKWPSPQWSPNHLTFLGNNVPLIEWCINLGQITENRVLFCCAPIKLKGTDGAPARVFAIEGVLSRQ